MFSHHSVDKEMLYHCCFSTLLQSVPLEVQEDLEALELVRTHLLLVCADVKSEILNSNDYEDTVFWNVTQCTLVNIYQST
jgi:hypothetical protein